MPNLNCVFCNDAIVVSPDEHPVCGDCQIHIGTTEFRSTNQENEQERFYNQNARVPQSHHLNEWEDCDFEPESNDNEIDAEEDSFAGNTDSTYILNEYQLSNSFVPEEGEEEEEEEHYDDSVSEEVRYFLEEEAYSSEVGTSEWPSELLSDIRATESDLDDFDELDQIFWSTRYAAMRQIAIADELQLLAQSNVEEAEALMRSYTERLESLSTYLEDSDSQRGASEVDILSLKKRVIANTINTERNTECAICTEKFESVELTELPCKHEYHTECIQQWLKLRDSCPMCRQPISTLKASNSTSDTEDPNLILFSRESPEGLRRHRSAPTLLLDDVD